MLFISFDIKPFIISCLHRQINIREYLFLCLLLFSFIPRELTTFPCLAIPAFDFYSWGFGLNKMCVNRLWNNRPDFFTSSKHTHVIRRGNGLLE